ncbi:MAG: hypothetical protein FWB96_06375 [Defluviitaleaceae bacterium]|nr:hypothetical protein [Defluviitaleaceae bacterium]MCL2263508.1 hypothetical protein [Defluviitaleaceae bacterium]
MRNKFLFLMLVALLAFAVACGGNNDAPPATGGDVAENGAVETNGAEDDTGVVPIARPAGVVYSLATDAHLQNAQVSDEPSEIGGSPYIVRADVPLWTVTGYGVNETNALAMSNRAGHGYSFDISTAAFDWDLANNTYMITVSGSIGGAGDVSITCETGEVFVAAEVGDGNFSLAAVIGGGLECGVIRIDTNAYQLYINEFMVSQFTSADLPRPANVVYSLSTDPLFQQLEPGTRGYRNVFITPILNPAGTPTYTIVEGPYGNAIQITNRTGNYNAVDFITDVFDWDFENYSYILTLHAHVQGGDTGLIGGADSPWNWLSPLDTDENGNFSISHLIDSYTSLEAAGSRRWFRLQSTCINPLTIYEVILEKQ